MSTVKESIYDVLKGKFLINKDAFENWRIIIFIVLLVLFMIASSHSVDKKVMRISELNKELKDYGAYFINTRSILMKLKLESAIQNKVMEIGLMPSEKPAQVIKVIYKNRDYNWQQKKRAYYLDYILSLFS